MLSLFVMAFLPRSKHILILLLRSPSAMILEKIKSVTVSIVSSSIVKCRVFPVVKYGCEIWTIAEELMFSNCIARDDSQESLGQQRDQTSQS